jgi:hypothetical protein
MPSGLGGLSDPQQQYFYSFKNVSTLQACMTFTKSGDAGEAALDRASAPTGTVTYTFTDPQNALPADIATIIKNPFANIGATLAASGIGESLVTGEAIESTITNDNVITIPYVGLRNYKSFTVTPVGVGMATGTATAIQDR